MYDVLGKTTYMTMDGTNSGHRVIGTGNEEVIRPGYLSTDENSPEPDAERIWVAVTISLSPCEISKPPVFSPFMLNVVEPDTKVLPKKN